MDRSIYQARIRAVQEKLAQQKLDGLIVVKPEHVRYLAGVWGYSARPEYASPRRLVAVVVPRVGDITLIVPKIELLYAKRRTWLSDVRHHVEWSSRKDEIFGGLTLLRAVLQEKGLVRGRLGLELSFISVRLHAMLIAEFPSATLEDSSSIIEELRMIKSPEEIRIMRIGAQMAVREYEAEVSAIRAGVREYEIAAVGRDEATRLAAEYIAEHEAGMPLEHPTNDGLQIITSGPRLDMVHALASTRTISKGDIVLLDFCRIPQLEYYRIGFSRNVALRELRNDEHELYRAVFESYAGALDVLKPGVAAEEPDLVARDILERAGLGETFVHRTGRGVGLEGVERPEIGSGDKTPLQPGMVVTVEPSIYFQNFAVHVEDTFLITEDGYEWLTRCPREVRILQDANG